MLRAKQNKLSAVKDLLVKPKKQVLTPVEISFLKARKVDVSSQYKQPLMIYSTDTKQTERIIRGIASKLDCPVIKIVVSVSKREVTRNEAASDDIAEETGYDTESLRQYKRVSDSIESGTRVPDLSYSHHREVASLTPEKQDPEVMEPEPEEVEAEPMEVEALAEGIRNGKYKLSFKNVWEFDDDDDDDDDNMTIKVRNKSDLKLFKHFEPDVMFTLQGQTVNPLRYYRMTSELPYKYHLVSESRERPLLLISRDESGG